MHAVSALTAKIIAMTPNAGSKQGTSETTHTPNTQASHSTKRENCSTKHCSDSAQPTEIKTVNATSAQAQDRAGAQAKSTQKDDSLHTISLDSPPRRTAASSQLETDQDVETIDHCDAPYSSYNGQADHERKYLEMQRSEQRPSGS